MFPSQSDPRAARIARFGLPPEVAAKIAGTKRCFLLAMGPSLEFADPAALAGEFVIGVNHIIKAGIIPDILCMVDRLRIDVPNLPKAPKIIALEHLLREKRHLFEPLPEGLCDFSTAYHMPFSKNWHHVDRFDPQLKTVYFGGSVMTDLAVPLAVYLGMEEICILGMDGVDRSFPSSHVWGNDQASRVLPPTEYLRYQTKVAQLAAKEGVKVFNASPGAPTGGFDRIDLMRYAPGIVRKITAPALKDRFIAFGDAVLQPLPGEEPGSWRFAGPAGKRFLSHAGGVVSLAAPGADAAQFIRDSSFFAEPGFVNRDWISLRAVSQPDRFITSDDSLSGWLLRPLSGIFSAYFSSFRPFARRADAEDRAEKLRMLRQLEDMKRSLGNQMIHQDRQR